ncbi:glucose-1-phosphate adenylyltransferase subunit GlgD [Lacticaseibacillus baoqingensis]|uniref:Glucose-1-phosphate adenylyltransferase subunit GlgD n=1 Tax=Lacticaseibacillus baoqingensis TaxID=2486013 RepID=A0ABW4E4U1_9LACO|nr:glucose-1-phosphate adenylyltransferase subunit GlgD [Lacticaseibacillus baoqingensis]
MRQGEMAAVIDLNEDVHTLLPLTEHRPIGTLPFAGRYRLLDFPLSAITAADIHSVGLFMPESERSVQDHIRSGAAWNLDLIQGGVFLFPYVATRDYNDQTLRDRYYENYTQFLRGSGSKYTVVMGAKNVANVNLTVILDYHKASDLRITTVYKQLTPERIQPDDWTLSLSEQGTANSVIQAKERSGDPEGAAIPSFMDMYVLATSDLIELLEDAAMHQVFRRLPELLRDYVLANNANAFEYTGYLARIDSIPRYYLANMEMLDDASFQSLLLSNVPILTKSKNEVPSFFAKDATVLNSLLGTGTYIEGTVQDSVIFRNVVVHRDATVEHSVIMQGAKISTGSTVQYAILDKGVVIGPNLNIVGTPEKPIVLRKNQTIFRESELEVDADA